MARFNKVTIIGVGLIGGSIGLAIKNRHAARLVTGVFRHASTLKRALKARAVDRGVMDIASGVKDADLVILATPVHFIPELVAKVLRSAKPGTIITDAGSTKEWIVRSVEKFQGKGSRVHFIGSHPMAGSEHTGVEYAVSDLFEDSPCIVTKTPKTDPKAVRKVALFWKSLGGRVRVMSPVEHDRTVSLISHLPHVVSFSLAGAVPGKALICAAEGFKDTTRVASSDPDLWADIFLTNRQAVVSAGRLFNTYAARVLKAIADNDRRTLVSLLKKAKANRDRNLYAKKV
jgi:prephenate dehydrogenase